MNNYPEWWNQTITVYNKYSDASGRITWYRHILRNCFWKDTDTMLVNGETIIQTNVTLCRVPVNKNFREKYVWDGLTSRGNYFTFGTGDIIVKGIAEDVVNEYEAGKRSSDLLTKYKNLQGCFVVEKCSVNTGNGRGNEHYYVRGV